MLTTYMGRNGCSSKLCPHQIEETEIESGRDENLIYRQLLALKAKASFSKSLLASFLFKLLISFHLQLICLSWILRLFVLKMESNWENGGWIIHFESAQSLQSIHFELLWDFQKAFSSIGAKWHSLSSKLFSKIQKILTCWTACLSNELKCGHNRRYVTVI